MAFELWRPEVYQGSGRRARYFEGWYFKVARSSAEEAWAFIPGIARGASRGEGHSFVQVIEGRTGRTWWFEYPLEEFRASRKELSIRVGGSRFDESGMSLDLVQPGARFSGRLEFGPLSRLRFSLLAPGVMGPFAFAPFMECSHGLVSLDHEVGGWLEGEGRRVDFSGGRGYAEKDWGSSMPSSWIWAQSNAFPAAGDALMVSVARIPWLGSSFAGFLCVARFGGRLLRFSTWDGSRIAELSVEGGEVGLVLAKRGLSLELKARPSRSGILRAPQAGLMSRRIAESMDAELSVLLREGGAELYSGTAPQAGLEVSGVAKELLAPTLTPQRAERPGIS